jgi:hypothetical protein
MLGLNACCFTTVNKNTGAKVELKKQTMWTALFWG